MRRASARSLAALVLATLVAGGCATVRSGGSEAGSAPVDLNRASVRAIQELPGITPSMAARIVAGRPYPDPTALVERGLLTRRELERIEDRIVVQGDAPAR